MASSSSLAVWQLCARVFRGVSASVHRRIQRAGLSLGDVWFTPNFAFTFTELEGPPQFTPASAHLLKILNLRKWLTAIDLWMVPLVVLWRR